MNSPFANIPPEGWLRKAKKIVATHPLKAPEIVEVVLGCWQAIFRSRIGGFRIGKDITPKPQIMGFLLHELIPLEFARRYPSVWSGESLASDKDLVYLPDPDFSIEIKTSSHGSQIFGNRSYAQAGAAKKSKSGFYLAINFEPFRKMAKSPKIARIRFGWLDSSDWIGQRAQTGQQARLSRDVERGKLVTLFNASP
jgi:ScaI restriction endonuclease